jgi:hypothetical protein
MFLLEVFDSLVIKEKSGDAIIKESFKNVLRTLRRAYKPIDITTNLYKKLNILNGYISIQNQQLTWLVFICMTKYKDEWNQILEKLMKKQFFFDFITNSKITEEMVEGYYRGDNVNRIEEDDENDLKVNIGKRIDETSSTYKVKPNIEYNPNAAEQEANENYNKYKESLDKNKTFFSRLSSLFNQGAGGAKQQKTQKQQKNRRPKKQKQQKQQKQKKQSKTKKIIYKK